MVDISSLPPLPPLFDPERVLRRNDTVNDKYIN